MKDGTQYHMLRVEYISGEIFEQQFTEDGVAIAPDPETNHNIYSSGEEVSLSLFEENRNACIRIEDCYVLVFTETAEPTAVWDALRNID